MFTEICNALDFYGYPYSQKNLHDLLKSFYETQLRDIDGQLYFKIMGLGYEDKIPSAKTLDRILNKAQSASTPKNKEVILKLLDLFLNKYENEKLIRNRENQYRFLSTTEYRLARRVSFFCSRGAHRPASFAELGDTETYYTLGEACMICVPYPESGKRYEKKPAKEYTSLANGIWLCADCAKLCKADAYSIKELEDWKKDCERYMKDWAMKGERPMGLLPANSDKPMCKNFFHFIEKREHFFSVAENDESTLYVNDVKEIVGYIMEQERTFEPFSVLDERTRAIARSCNYFLRRTKKEENALAIKDSFMALRVAIALNLNDIQREYKVAAGSKTKKILPVNNPGKKTK